MKVAHIYRGQGAIATCFSFVEELNSLVQFISLHIIYNKRALGLLSATLFTAYNSYYL